MSKLQELKDAVERELKIARDVSAKADGEGRDFSPEERTDVMAAMERAKVAKTALDQYRDDENLKGQILALGEGIGVEEGSAERRKEAGQGFAAKGRTVGQRFAEADAFQGWLKTVAPNGEIPDSARGIISPAIAYGGLDDLMGRKTLVTGTSETSAGATVYPQDLGVQSLGEFQRPLTVVDVITRGRTTSDTVSYARVTGFTNAAAPTAEATAATGTSGTKPESAMTLERVDAVVKTIAHWIPATKRALSDAAQIKTLIDNFLQYGLKEELEDQIISGNGSGENFDGIGHVSGVQAQAWDTDLLTTLRKAKTKVRVVGRADANAYMLHPNDAERLDLLKSVDPGGLFYFGGPIDGGTPRVWRLPIVESEAVPEGTGYVGDFRQAVLWDREQSSIQVSDSHSDFFVRNMVAILAEMRAAFGVFRPKAFVEIDLTA